MTIDPRRTTRVFVLMFFLGGLFMTFPFKAYSHPWQSLPHHYCGDQITQKHLFLTNSVSYFENITDLPVMPGLKQDAENSYVFDKASGRIVQQVGVSEKLTKQDVRKYYDEVLQALGWKNQGKDVYRRGDEKMKLSFENKNKHLKVVFLIVPA